MEIFTLSTCMLERGISIKDIYKNVLIKLDDKTIAVDGSGEIIDIYESLAASNESIAGWLNLLSMIPSAFEAFIEDIPPKIPRDNIELFVFLCSIIEPESNLLVYSNSILNRKDYNWNSSCTIIYNNKTISVLDHKLAKNTFGDENPKSVEIYKDSIVAKDGSTISEIKKT